MAVSKSNENNENHFSFEFGSDELSKDNRLCKLLRRVFDEVKEYAEDKLHHIGQLTRIGLALSAEKDINKLLELIVDEARSLSKADAGTLYILDPEKRSLRFEIMQNDTMQTRLGGTSCVPITLPDVPLYVDGKPNHANVSSHVALTGQTVNIPDVYKAEGFDFTGPRKYDAETGYRSRSMLVIAMQNHENKIIGVLQLLNAQDPETGRVVAFHTEHEKLVASLASLAAVALTKTQLIQDLNNLFYAFIKSIATAIDEKSPYTGGHISRVVKLTMMIAEKINTVSAGRFKNVFFSEDELEELRLAAWMHDVGKITTPEAVIDKAAKLEKILDRIEIVEMRFTLIAQKLETAAWRNKCDLLQSEDPAKSEKIRQIEKDLADARCRLQKDLDFIKTCNTSGEFMPEEHVERIHHIAQQTYRHQGLEHPYLTADEVKNLSIRKGTLTEEERKVIENHALMTYKILTELPFPSKLRNIPEYASSHHEKLDGSGYPRHLTGDQLPLQSRIMAVADIFDALTAKDRPYKEPMRLTQVLKIMEFMKKDNHIDPDIHDLFVETGLYRDYAVQEMAAEQIDT